MSIPTGWRLLASIVALVLAIALLWAIVDRLFFAPGRAREAAATAQVERKVGETAVATGKDALATTERVIERNTRIERITETNHERILAAPGADDPIPAGVDAAFVAALCLRDGYKSDPACIGVPVAPAG